jgi:hypothetical protein
METTGDLRDLTYDFLMSLPATIKDSVLSLVIIYAIHISPPRDEDHGDIVHDYLFNPMDDSIFLVGKLLSVIAALDYIPREPRR